MCDQEAAGVSVFVYPTFTNVEGVIGESTGRPEKLLNNKRDTGGKQFKPQQASLTTYD